MRDAESPSRTSTKVYLQILRNLVDLPLTHLCIEPLRLQTGAEKFAGLRVENFWRTLAREVHGSIPMATRGELVFGVPCEDSQSQTRSFWRKFVVT